MIGVERFNFTDVPETATELTTLATELTRTLKEDIAGTKLANELLYVMESIVGVALSTEELIITGIIAETLLVTF